MQPASIRDHLSQICVFCVKVVAAFADAGGSFLEVPSLFNPDFWFFHCLPAGRRYTSPDFLEVYLCLPPAHGYQFEHEKSPS
jgi:hypothetical protein